MSRNFFELLGHAFKLMAENKLRKDIDDTLLEKLLNLINKSRLKTSDSNADIEAATCENHLNTSHDFIEELIKRTEVLYLVEKVLYSIANKDKNYPILIKSFVIRLLGLIFMSSKKFYSHVKLLPLLKYTNENMVVDHNPSIQDALLDCLSCITKQLEGAIWFIDQNLTDFIYSSFNSSSCYVRKSSVKFFIDFISQWMHFKIPNFEQRKLEESYLEHFVKSIISHIVNHIHFYNNSKEIIFSRCCISLMEQVLELENIESLIGDHLKLAKNISECFMNLADDEVFNIKLIDLLLAIHFKFALSSEVIIDVMKCLIIKEDIKLAIYLASSFASMAKSEHCSQDELMFFLLPLHILMNIPLTRNDSIFTIKSDFVYNITLRKMEDKSGCKALISSSLSALQRVVPYLNSEDQRIVGIETLKIVQNSNHPDHKWFHSVLEDRVVHQSFIEFYSSLLSEEVYSSLKFEGSDLVFQNVMEFLKKSTSDCNFLSQLFLLMKDILILHKKFEFDLEEIERSSLIQILCRGIHDKREYVVDSALHLSEQMINNTAWQNTISKQGIHSIIWDLAIQGNHDGTIRSTALKVIIEGCQEAWCLNEMKSLKGITETDIVKILFDLTYDPDFFLQREALSSLYRWLKSKWDDLQFPSKEYLLSALVTAIKSLDLELKLISLDAWLWLLENKFAFSAISSSFDVKEFIEYLANSGFGLSMILAIEDYDLVIQFKAADILAKLKQILINRGISFDSLMPNSSDANGTPKCDMCEHLAEPVSKEEKLRGIDNVIEISTTDQITNICQLDIAEWYDFKQEYFPIDNEGRKCSVSSFWICLWSENVTSILQPISEEDNDIDGESLLNDIISARILEYNSHENTHDCY